MTVVLVRHARAGHRTEWEGDDRRRPLDKKGRKQAQALVELLASCNLDRLLASPFERCVQTLEPLARARGLEIEVRKELGEQEQFDAGAVLVRSLLDQDVAICGHAGLSDVITGASQKKAEAFVLDEHGQIQERIRP
jgi:phosphohistidine phosphatase SixA